MEKEKKGYVAHCVVLGYPAQGHITPVLQFSKRLAQKGVKVTLVSTFFFCKTLPVRNFISNNNITLETISDGFDEGGLEPLESTETYIKEFWRVGPRTLSELLYKLASSDFPVDCVVYDALMPWALEVAKKHDLFGACFFTQTCAVQSIYFHAHQKLIKMPFEKKEIISLPGMPDLESSDLPSFLYKYGSYPFILEFILDQFTNIEKADWVLANTFYELEQEVVEWMEKIWPLKTIGPTVPSMLFDKRVQDDIDYGISMFKPNNEACMKWLNERPKQSVIYVSFGSLAALSEDQMEEMGWSLIESECYFLWVVRASEEAKVPKSFLEHMMSSEKGLVVTWCPQLQVLSHEAVGCFVTHCGWNSTLEALCLGVPMVGVPQWADQNTNAKYIMDVWKMGITARVDEIKGIVTRQEVKQCVKQILKSERGIEMKNNAIYWRNMAINAMNEGGSSDKNIEEFVTSLTLKSQHKGSYFL